MREATSTNHYHHPGKSNNKILGVEHLKVGVLVLNVGAAHEKRRRDGELLTLLFSSHVGPPIETDVPQSKTVQAVLMAI